ncbi:hypothetical protein Ahy_A03g016146 [Arachis hypogaea]|uniref:Serine/threonine-protein phosphatase 4 regulatory subunit 2 n=1 Tax=Arachis hypogaea TaxID=3818 RepID=A0A445E2F2_ARAHY|nr:hypothetical protein Ahy_A03g016146 [Arachis hypogaea]
MEVPLNENLEQTAVSSVDAVNPHSDDVVPDSSNHRDGEQDSEQRDDDVSREEVRKVLEVIASTGKFWCESGPRLGNGPLFLSANVVRFLNDRHDWDKLKTMLSFQLKQVLAEYPEAKMTSEQQYASLGESYSEVVNKLDDALTCFIEGPPFTLQRLCEILLDAKGIYPHLSKLALALEKNLLVTSTLTISTDPFPQATTVHELDEQENANEKQQLQLDGIENGTEPPVADKDEVMAEADTGEDMTIDTVASEDAKSSETKSEPDANNA